MSKTLKVKQLKRVLEEIPDDLPVVVAGGGFRVTEAQVVYQTMFSNMDADCRGGESPPVAVMLKVVAV